MALISKINDWLWSVPILLLIVGVGAYLSIRTGFAQLRLLWPALMSLGKKMKSTEGGSSFKALCTALGATVGTGNIAGVAGALAIGGPGSIFWMWVCAFLGMATKFAEALLAVVFRRANGPGDYSGGPMYIIEKGLGSRWRPMALCYSLLGLIAAFGVGNATQVNAVVDSVNLAICQLGGQESWNGNLIVGFALAAASLAVLTGGVKRIGNFAEMLVPAAAAAYLILCMGALAAHSRLIPDAFCQILCGAFTPKAVTGGTIGSCMVALRTGAARGVFTNEAGMGTAAIAHGTADVRYPAEQGLMGIIEVFLDTIRQIEEKILDLKARLAQG